LRDALWEHIEKDLIIIGAGINGLSAGLAYALNNDLQKKRVLIVEKNPVSGGYVRSFERKGYRFDTCQMISNISDIWIISVWKLIFTNSNRTSSECSELIHQRTM